MKRLGYVIQSAALTLAVGCASFPPPTQRLADAEAARRSAQELGASNDQNARLHAQLADEQIKKARELMKSGDDNKEADRMLQRAEADADVAIALAREKHAKAELAETIDRANATSAMTGNPGAQP